MERSLCSGTAKNYCVAPAIMASNGWFGGWTAFCDSDGVRNNEVWQTLLIIIRFWD